MSEVTKPIEEAYNPMMVPGETGGRITRFVPDQYYSKDFGTRKSSVSSEAILAEASHVTRTRLACSLLCCRLLAGCSGTWPALFAAATAACSGCACFCFLRMVFFCFFFFFFLLRSCFFLFFLFFFFCLVVRFLACARCGSLLRSGSK